MNERNKFVVMFWRKRYDQGSRTNGGGGGDEMCLELFSPSSLVNALTQSLTLAFCSLAHELSLHSSFQLRIMCSQTLVTYHGYFEEQVLCRKEVLEIKSLLLFAYFINTFSFKVQLWGPANSRKCVLENARMSDCISVASQLYSLYITQAIILNLFTKR